MSISVETLALAKKNTKQAIGEALTSVYTYRGSVETLNDLPTSGQKVGDVYNVVSEAGQNYAWDGSNWDALGIAENLGDIEFEGEEIVEKDVSFDGNNDRVTYSQYTDCSKAIPLENLESNQILITCEGVNSEPYYLGFAFSNNSNSISLYSGPGEPVQNIGNNQYIYTIPSGYTDYKYFFLPLTTEERGPSGTPTGIKIDYWINPIITYKILEQVTVTKTINNNYLGKNQINKKIETVANQANTAYSEALVAHNQANVGYNRANAAYDRANTAYDDASTALSTTSNGSTLLINIKNNGSYSSMSALWNNSNWVATAWNSTNFRSNAENAISNGSYDFMHAFVNNNIFQNVMNNYYYDKNATNSLTNDTLNEAKAYTDSKFDISLKKEVVQTLPVSNIDEDTLYLVPKSNSTNGDIYDEYLYGSHEGKTDAVTVTSLPTTMIDVSTYNKLYLNKGTPTNFKGLSLIDRDGNILVQDIRNNLNNGQPIDISNYSEIKITGYPIINIDFSYQLSGLIYNWEKIGSTSTDLSGYYTSNEVDNIVSNVNNDVTNVSNQATCAENLARSAGNIANNAYDTANAATNLAQAAYDAANSLAPAAWELVSTVTTNQETNSITLPIDKEYDEYLIIFNRPVALDGSNPADSMTSNTGVLTLFIDGNGVIGNKLPLYNKMEGFYTIEKIVGNMYHSTGYHNQIMGSGYNYQENIVDINDATNTGVVLSTSGGEAANIASNVTITLYGKGEQETE